ncbi:MAG: glycolate oxidase subunit GlcF [Xanthomonadales bacterium]|nr:glycolate oxidase subunit GlcF [Xanthomonadales bacterium]
MQTFLRESFKQTADGREAEAILRSCVHCGFCNATCPTYELLGDERDGPRGRIYLIKELLEKNTASRETQVHLDRCLTCRACETTCPSGVQYNRLLEIGRAVIEKRIERPWTERVQRTALLQILPRPNRFRSVLGLANFARPLLPASLKKGIPAVERQRSAWPSTDHARKVLLLEGCAQSVAAPRINLAAARVLDRIGIQALPAPGCCGALSHHLSREDQTENTIRANIDRWWPQIEAGVEALLITASGCAPTVMDYDRIMHHDPEYAGKAERIASVTGDISSFLANQDPECLASQRDSCGLVAFHSPCTLQHGLKSGGKVEALLRHLGFELAIVSDSHLCCGSAGSYSILQKGISRQLLNRKLACLEREKPALIATANIGCLMHLQSGTELPVKHWIELLL